MQYGCVFAGVAVCVVAGIFPASAQTFTSLDVARPSPQFMRVYGNAQPPYGFIRFCEVNGNECSANSLNDARFPATPERLSELDLVNRSTNQDIEPATDLEIFGVNELWTLPMTRGDCEDFALLKRQRLIKLGWPSSGLLITVVRDEKNEGHAVLTARTTQGDFILDNKIDNVRLWNQTPYHYVMRQSYIDPRVWVSLDPTDPTTPTAIAGVQSNPE